MALNTISHELPITGNYTHSERYDFPVLRVYDAEGTLYYGPASLYAHHDTPDLVLEGMNRLREQMAEVRDMERTALLSLIAEARDVNEGESRTLAVLDWLREQVEGRDGG